MIKVIIADDEPLLLRSLKKSIESLDSEYEVIGQATNGHMALEMVEKLQPDILFTDIKMPVFDGIELAAFLRERKHSIRIVLISGYQEFEYAKRAITLEVEDYLVKPINPLLLSELLRKLKKKLNKNRYEDQLLYLQELIHNGISGREVDLFDNEKEFFLVYLCMGTYISYRDNQFTDSIRVDNYKKIIEVLEQKLSEDMYWILDGKYDNEKLVIGTVKQNRVLAEEIFHAVEMQGGLNITMVYQAGIYDHQQFREKLLEAGLLLKHEIRFAGSQIIFPEEWKEKTSKKQNLLTRERLEKWNFILKKHAIVEMTVFIRNMLKELSAVSCCQEELTGALRNLYFMIGRQLQVSLEISMVDLAVSISQNYSELEKNVLQLFQSTMEMNVENSDKDNNSIHTIETIKAYIDYNYTEKLSIMELANKFGFNYSYLCTGFKKVFGETPNDYVIHKRIDRAKALLDAEPLLSIKEIAVMAGYDNPYYFSRIFKNVIQMTPSQYRKRSKKDGI